MGRRVAKGRLLASELKGFAPFAPRLFDSDPPRRALGAPRAAGGGHERVIFHSNGREVARPQRLVETVHLRFADRLRRGIELSDVSADIASARHDAHEHARVLHVSLQLGV